MGLCEYVFLSEFDIDKGSTLKISYPCAVAAYEPSFFAEAMLPEGAHNRKLDWTIFLMRRNLAGDENAPPLLYCISLVRTMHDASVRRGALCKAIAVCSPFPFVHLFQAPLILALDRCFELGLSSEESIVIGLYDALNAIDLGDMPAVSDLDRRLMHRGVVARTMGRYSPKETPDRQTFVTKLTLFGTIMPVEVPLHCTSDEVGDASLKQLIDLFGDSTMQIWNSVVAEERILFMGYNVPTSNVCNLVLAACALACPPLDGVVHRVYPYCSLQDLGFLECKGFIAGGSGAHVVQFRGCSVLTCYSIMAVTNPMFRNRLEVNGGLCCILCAQL